MTGSQEIDLANEVRLIYEALIARFENNSQLGPQGAMASVIEHYRVHGNEVLFRLITEIYIPGRRDDPQVWAEQKPVLDAATQQRIVTQELLPANRLVKPLGLEQFAGSFFEILFEHEDFGISLGLYRALEEYLRDNRRIQMRAETSATC